MPIVPVDQKFHTLNASTPTKDRGSAQTDSLREIYTMQDIIDTVGGGGGGQTEGEDLSLIVRSNAYSAVGDHEGTVLSIGTLGLTAATVYMWDGSEWGTANASSDATASGLLGISTDTASAPNVLVSGIIQLASVPGSVGAPLYLDTTNGGLSASAPTGFTQIVRVLGYKLSSDKIYFDPSKDWLEIA
jgi:hypothetical protein